MRTRGVHSVWCVQAIRLCFARYPPPVLREGVRRVGVAISAEAARASSLEAVGGATAELG
jgi:hypothetical protein